MNPAVSLAINWTPRIPTGLRRNQIDIWCRRLTVSPAEYRFLSSLLSADEKNRASRFRFSHLQQGFVVARATLRQILSHYLKKLPSELSFSYEERGKPQLCSRPGAGNLSFNVSHSHDLALYGVGWNRKIGIDVEKVRADIDLPQMVRDCLSPAEAESLWKIPPERQRHVFFQLWTRKEAYLKAFAVGLNIPLTHLHVGLPPDGSGGMAEDSNLGCQFLSFRVADDFPATLVYAGHCCQIRFLFWDQTV